MLIDSHAHLDSPQFDSDRVEVMERAKAAGVSKIISIGAGSGSSSASSAVDIAEKNSFVWATVGIHPNDSELKLDFEEIERLARHPKVVAIGETGLDFYRERASQAQQETYFRKQIALAREVSKPLVIHSREAGGDCLKILQKEQAREVGGVFHCFAEDAEFAKRLLELNFLVSFPGIVTFKNAKNVHEACRAIPLDQILVETDAPFLAPEPFRGKRAEPAHVEKTARAIATIKGISFEELAQITTANCERLFRI